MVGVQPPARSPSRPTADESGDIKTDSHKREVKIGLPVMIGFIMMLVAIATFSSNFLFATKPDVQRDKIDTIERIETIKRDVATVRSEVTILSGKIDTVSKVQKRNRTEQRIIDENIRKLLRDRSVTAAPRLDATDDEEE